MPVRRSLLVVCLLLAAAPAAAAEVSAAADPALAALAREALEKSPEYARAQREVAAERQRVPQAGALGDPTVTLGIQNDGFDSIKIGTMETSYWQVMVTQPLPWPGKRARRADAARAQAAAVGARLKRVELSVTAEVERAYLDLALTRGQLALLDRLDGLWKQAEATVRSRYDVGEAPQSDVIRAQLERTRLRQQRIALETSERTLVETLNRLRVHPLDEPIETGTVLAADEPSPAVPSAEEAVTDAERRSPDLAMARASVVAADRTVESADRERLPDFTVSAGIMPRGGLPPMWTASVGITLPVFSHKGAAVDEARERREAEASGEETTRQIVALRARERQAALEAAVRMLRLYRDGLLVQSRAASESTLSQYRVGRVPFASVLDALRGVVQDESGYLQTWGEAERITIAMREVSLDAPAGTGAGGAVSSGGVPASGGGGGAGMSTASAAGGGGASGGAGAAPAAGPKSGGGGGGM